MARNWPKEICAAVLLPDRVEAYYPRAQSRDMGRWPAYLLARLDRAVA